MSNSKTLSLVNPSEINTLLRVVECQYDISQDTVTDDLFVSSLNDDRCMGWSNEKVQEVRKSTSDRIDVLVMLTHVLALLQNTHSDLNIVMTEADMQLLYNEVDMHLSMLDDMLTDDTDEPIRDKVKHIVNVNLIHQKMK